MAVSRGPFEAAAWHDLPTGQKSANPPDEAPGGLELPRPPDRANQKLCKIYCEQCRSGSSSNGSGPWCSEYVLHTGPHLCADCRHGVAPPVIPRRPVIRDESTGDERVSDVNRAEHLSERQDSSSDSSSTSSSTDSSGESDVFEQISTNIAGSNHDESAGLWKVKRGKYHLESSKSGLHFKCGVKIGFNASRIVKTPNFLSPTCMRCFDNSVKA